MDIKFEDIVDRLINGEHDFNIASELSDFLNNAVKEANAREAARKKKEEEERLKKEAVKERERSLRDHAEYFTMGIMSFLEEFCDSDDFRKYVETKEEELIDTFTKTLDEFSTMLPLLIKMMDLDNTNPKVEKKPCGTTDRAIGDTPKDGSKIKVPLNFNINSKSKNSASAIRDLSDEELSKLLNSLTESLGI